MTIFLELWNYIKKRKKFTLLILLTILSLFGIILVSQNTVVTPLIYTLF